MFLKIITNENWSNIKGGAVGYDNLGLLSRYAKAIQERCSSVSLGGWRTWRDCWCLANEELRFVFCLDQTCWSCIYCSVNTEKQQNANSLNRGTTKKGKQGKEPLKSPVVLLLYSMCQWKVASSVSGGPYWRFKLLQLVLPPGNTES